MKVNLSLQDLTVMADFARMLYKVKAQPREMDNAEFIALCNAQALERVLATKNIEFTFEYIVKGPYEPME